MPYRRKKLTFAISSPDEFLSLFSHSPSDRAVNNYAIKALKMQSHDISKSNLSLYSTVRLYLTPLDRCHTCDFVAQLYRATKLHASNCVYCTHAVTNRVNKPFFFVTFFFYHPHSKIVRSNCESVPIFFQILD